ncbi:MAG: GDP-L-fucose synthase family protein [Aridibacter sp.]
MKEKNNKIYIAGSTGMVGSAIKKHLNHLGYSNLICKTSEELNLINQKEVETFFSNEKPEIVILAAGKVGGILANDTYRAEFIYNNLMIEANVIHASYKNSVKKLIFLGSSCIYPKFAEQPISEEELLTGNLEPTNEPYAIAKIAGIKLCENYYRQYGCNFYSVMPTNLYGADDNFDLQSSHVIPALIRKIHEAKTNNSPKVTLWGTGSPRREFLYVDDLAEAVIFLMQNIDAGDIYRQSVSHINIGLGEDIEIKKLAELIKKIVGFEGKIEYDTTKPDGMPQKLLNSSRLNNLGWKYNTTLEDGLRKTYEWFLQNHSTSDTDQI